MVCSCNHCGACVSRTYTLNFKAIIARLLEESEPISGACCIVFVTHPCVQEERCIFVITTFLKEPDALLCPSAHERIPDDAAEMLDAGGTRWLDGVIDNRHRAARGMILDICPPDSSCYGAVGAVKIIS